MTEVSPFTTTAHAQAYNGAIVGTVTDTGGASIPNVKVTAINTGTNSKYTATTSGSGSYSIAQLPVGVYVVQAEAPISKRRSPTTSKYTVRRTPKSMWSCRSVPSAKGDGAGRHRAGTDYLGIRR
jgi:hypothetical protein